MSARGSPGTSMSQIGRKIPSTLAFLQGLCRKNKTIITCFPLPLRREPSEEGWLADFAGSPPGFGYHNDGFLALAA